MANAYWRAKMILETSKKRWLKINPNLTESSGIYILTRIDENGIKYAYIGQAKHILTRLAQHLTQYQHIDLSLKKHKLFDENKNPYGWQVDYYLTLESELDEYERKFIKEYAEKGYQLRNKTAGGQNVGKVGIDDNKASKGYYDGLKQGYKNCLKDIREYFEKYLTFSVIDDKKALKKNGEVKEIYSRKYVEFLRLMMEGKDDEQTM